MTIGRGAVTSMDHQAEYFADLSRRIAALERAAHRHGSGGAGGGGGGGGDNILINGDGRCQQPSGAAVTAIPGGALTYSVDGWHVRVSSIGTGRVTTDGVNELTTPGTGYGIKAYLNTAQASLAATDFGYLRQNVEGYRALPLHWLSVDALSQPAYLSFWIKADIAGEHSVAISAPSGNPSYVATFTVATAGVWQEVFIVIPAPSTGTWGVSNTTGLTVTFPLWAGSTFTTATPNTWVASEEYIASTSVQYNNATVGQGIQVTAIRLAPTEGRYVPRSIPTELLECQRYFWRFQAGESDGVYANGFSHAGSDVTSRVVLDFPVEMRVIPTLTATTSSWKPHGSATSYSVSAEALDAAETSVLRATIELTHAATGAAGAPGHWCGNTTVSTLAFDART